MKKLFFTLLFLYATTIAFSQINIFDVCRKGTVNDIISIYNKNPEIINKSNEHGYTPLTLACYHGNEEVVDFLIDKVDDINGTSNYGTPLMAAVVKGSVDIVDLLLSKKADTSIPDSNGTTALHYAVMFKNYGIVKLLVNAKADIHIKDKRNNSALDYALILDDKKLNNLLKNNQL